MPFQDFSDSVIPVDFLWPDHPVVAEVEEQYTDNHPKDSSWQGGDKKDQQRYLAPRVCCNEGILRISKECRGASDIGRCGNTQEQRRIFQFGASLLHMLGQQERRENQARCVIGNDGREDRGENTHFPQDTLEGPVLAKYKQG